MALLSTLKNIASPSAAGTASFAGSCANSVVTARAKRKGRRSMFMAASCHADGRPQPSAADLSGDLLVLRAQGDKLVASGNAVLCLGIEQLVAVLLGPFFPAKLRVKSTAVGTSAINPMPATRTASHSHLAQFRETASSHRGLGALFERLICRYLEHGLAA